MLAKLLARPDARLLAVSRDKCLVARRQQQQQQKQQQKEGDVTVGQDGSSSGSSSSDRSSSGKEPFVPALLQPAGEMLLQINGAGVGAGAVSSSESVFLGIDGEGVPYFAVEVDSSSTSREAVAALGDAGAFESGEGYLRMC